MLIKLVDGEIACAKSNDFVVMQSPKYLSACDDNTIPWIDVDYEVVRLLDNSLVRADDERILADVKQRRLAELEDSFNARVSGSVTINPGGYVMQFNVSDSLKMQGAIQLMEATGQTEGYLTQADDTTIYHIPLETMKAVLVEMLTAYAACHGRKQELRAAINAAQTEKELNAIEITWPV